MDNYLIHRDHKYLYKKKVNGKWRYFYDVGKANWKNGNTNIGSDGQSTDSNIRGYTKFQDIIGVDERDRRDRAVARYNNARNTYEKQQYMTIDELIRKNVDLENSFNKQRYEGEAASRAIEDFRKTPLGKIENINHSVQRGKNIVANILEKGAKKLRK